jgi:alpha-pyrone synthase
MGCFGGIAGLRCAESIALSNANYRVLLVCTELCSLQVQLHDNRYDNFVAEAIFGDGKHHFDWKKTDIY